MLNHARDDHMGKLDQNVEDDAQQEMPQFQQSQLNFDREG